jgi:hypothetical protein
MYELAAFCAESARTFRHEAIADNVYNAGQLWIVSSDSASPACRSSSRLLTRGPKLLTDSTEQLEGITTLNLTVSRGMRYEKTGAVFKISSCAHGCAIVFIGLVTLTGHSGHAWSQLCHPFFILAVISLVLFSADLFLAKKELNTPLFIVIIIAFLTAFLFSIIRMTDLEAPETVESAACDRHLHLYGTYH